MILLRVYFFCLKKNLLLVGIFKQILNFILVFKKFFKASCFIVFLFIKRLVTHFFLISTPFLIKFPFRAETFLYFTN